MNFVQRQRLTLFSFLVNLNIPQLQTMDKMSQLLIHDSSSLEEQTDPESKNNRWHASAYE